MKAQVYIDTKNTTISVKNKSFYIQNETQNRVIAPKNISSIALLSNVSINASAIKLAAVCEIPLYYYDYTGNLIAQLIAPDFLKHAELRKKQILFMMGVNGKEWVQNQLKLKTDLQIQTLQRYLKTSPVAYKKVAEQIEKMEQKRNILIQIEKESDNFTATTMAAEGGIAREYYKAINIILPETYRFSKRSRRPGLDYFNVALNYLYGMTYAQVGKAIQAAGLDSYVGALHKTPFKETLVYDSIEIFRPIIDRLLVDICKSETFDNTHFQIYKNGYLLNKNGKKLIIPLYTDYLQSRIKMREKVMSIEKHIYNASRLLRYAILEITNK